MLQNYIKTNPASWQAYWLMGKGYQVISAHEPAYAAFMRAYDINREEASVPQELVLEAICSGRIDEGVVIAAEVVSRHPDEVGLVSNLGLAYLAAGQLPKARETTERALTLDPSDKIVQSLLSVIGKVERGGQAPSLCGQ